MCLFDWAIRCQTAQSAPAQKTLPDSLRRLARSALGQLRLQKLKVTWNLIVRQESPTVFHQIVYGELSSRFSSLNRGSGMGNRFMSRAAERLPVSGDGGFLFSAMELETAVRLKLNLVHMVWIDETIWLVLRSARSTSEPRGRISALSTWSSTLRRLARKA